MIFSSLTDQELERWIRNSPQDHKAKAEMLKRGVVSTNHDNARLEELEDEACRLTDENDQLVREMAKLRSQLDCYENT